MNSIRSITAVFSILLLSAASAGAISDHQQCFKIKDDLAKTSYTLDLTPGDVDYPTSSGCQIKTPPKLFCIDAEKSNVVPTPPGAPAGAAVDKTLCYKLKCPSSTALLTSQQDQFGNHGLTVGKAAYLCAPANPDFCLTNSDCAAVPNGAGACMSNTCGVGQCNTDFGDCNTLEPDGCEADLDTDYSNCGTCNSVCPAYPNAGGSCTGGTCVMGGCSSGYGDCNVNSGDGCEADLNVDSSNCGTCNVACPVYPNADENCTGGICMMGGCDPGYFNCDSNPANGCEINNLVSNPLHCGACGIVCTNMNGTTTCSGGSCIPVCSTNFGNCNGNPNDGCETNVGSDPSNCGFCGLVCPVTNPTCVSGTCM